MNFRNKWAQPAAWCPPTTGQPWTQIDHVAISYRWRSSVTDSCSYWNTFVDSDHALVHCRFSFNFLGGKKNQTQRLAVEKLSDQRIKDKFQRYLNQTLSDDCIGDVQCAQLYRKPGQLCVAQSDQVSETTGSQRERLHY